MTMRVQMIVALAALVLLVASATPERAAAQAASEIPRTAAGKPDFNGIYEWPRALPGADTCRCSATIFDRKNFAPLLGNSAEPFLEPRTGDARHDEPRAFCMPAGFPSGMLSANAMQFSQTGNYLIVLHEFQGMKRIIPLDGRPHRKGIEPSYYGDSVGHWEGDTLVVDVTGFNDKTWLAGTGTFHTDALHITERYTRVDKDQINYEVTMEDPNVLTKPWTLRSTIMLREGTRLQEYPCTENNLDPERYEKLLKDGVNFTRDSK